MTLKENTEHKPAERQQTPPVECTRELFQAQHHQMDAVSAPPAESASKSENFKEKPHFLPLLLFAPVLHVCHYHFITGAFNTSH